jgi:hypothetical protein
VGDVMVHVSSDDGEGDVAGVCATHSSGKSALVAAFTVLRIEAGMSMKKGASNIEDARLPLLEGEGRPGRLRPALG